MSAIIGMIATALITGLVLPAGVRRVNRAINKLSTGAKGAKLTSGDTLANGLDRPKSIGANFTPIRTTFPAGTAVEDAKRTILDSVTSQEFYTADGTDLEAQFGALERATTLAEVEKTGSKLVASIQDSHQRVFANGVRLASERAAVKLGFSKLESLASPLRSSTIRFAATDSHGRTLVTEIDTRPDLKLKIDTEVLGVKDNSCQDILDQYYEALQVEGVVVGAAPKREPTGGVCNLSAARDFLARKIGPIINVETAADADSTTCHSEAEELRLRLNRARSRSDQKVRVSRK